MFRLATRVPTATGLNATKITQLAAGANVGPQVLSCVNDVLPVPVMEMPVMFKGDVPALVTVTICATEVVPLAVVAKVSFVVLSVTESWIVPVPLRAAVCGEGAAVSATLNVALSAPAAAGLKATKTVQLAPAVSEAPQLFNSRNEVGLVPAIVIELSVTVVVPVFFTTTGRATLVDPATVFGNTRVAGVNVMADVRAAPVPVRATFCGEPVALSATASVAVRVPVVNGLKVMEMVQLAPAAKEAVHVVVAGKEV